MGTYKISDLAIEISERVNDPKNSDYDIFVGLEHYDSGEFIIHRYGSTRNLDSSAKVFKSGDILLARRNVYLKRAGIVNFDGLTSGDSIVLRAKKPIYQKLLPYIFNTNDFWNYAIQHADGTMSKRLSPKQLLEYEVELPDSDGEKEKLSNDLWKINDLLDSYRGLISKSNDLIRAKFIELTKSDAKLTKLEDIAQKWYKGQPLKKDDISNEGKHYCIHYGELFTVYGPIIDNVFSKTNIAPTKTSKAGLILFPASDVTPNGLTRCSCITRDNVVLGGDIIVMEPKSNINPCYLSYAINFQKSQLLSRVTGSLIKHISSKSLESVTIPIISQEKQNEFVTFARKISKTIDLTKESLSRLELLNKKIIEEKFTKKGK